MPKKLVQKEQIEIDLKFDSSNETIYCQKKKKKKKLNVLN